jgi:hypothetical protein
MCQQAKNEKYNEKCEEIQWLKDAHNLVMYQKIKELKSNRTQCSKIIKSEEGKLFA